MRKTAVSRLNRSRLYGQRKETPMQSCFPEQGAGRLF